MEPVPLRSLFFILQVVSLLAALPRTSHIVHYAPGNSRACRRDTTRIILNNQKRNKTGSAFSCRAFY
ncbi:hypothetical protein A6J81_25430 [Citrobacter braakii]|nr:hypothetical protein A6J81_25430 [Citrobacter braakii]